MSQCLNFTIIIGGMYNVHIRCMESGVNPWAGVGAPDHFFINKMELSVNKPFQLV